MWNHGGAGFGLCEMAGIMMHAMDKPGSGKEDLKSIVTVGAPPEKYTDEELQKLADFSDHATAEYDGHGWAYRRGANLICFDKTEIGEDQYRWLRKRLTWHMGTMYSETLEHAMAWMEPDREKRQELLASFPED